MLNLIIKISRLLLLAFSFVCFRDKRKWVFGSYACFADNPKYLYLYLFSYSEYRQIRVIWISKTKDEYEQLKQHEIETYMRWSVKGLYHCLTSGVYIYSSYVSDINEWTIGRAYKINLWHGVGIKNIERKITRGNTANIFKEKSFIKKLGSLPFHIRPDYMLSTSPMMNKHFAACFDIPESRIVESLYPRCFLFDKPAQFINDFVSKYESEKTADIISSLKKYSYVYIYMPTWRDTHDDFFEELGFNMIELNKALEKTNSVMLLKLHPVTRSRMDLSGLSLTNIIVVDPNMDIYPVLPSTDCLITDYSSIYYDYILLKDKKVIFYIPDFDNYIRSERDLAFDYNECTVGKKIFDFDTLLEEINSQCNNGFDQNTIISAFWGSNSYSMDYLCEQLFQKIGLGA